MDALRRPQPVEVSEYRCNVLVTRWPVYQSGCSIENRLKSTMLERRESRWCRVAVVEASHDQRDDQRLEHVVRHWMSDAAKLPQNRKHPDKVPVTWDRIVTSLSMKMSKSRTFVDGSTWSAPTRTGVVGRQCWRSEVVHQRILVLEVFRLAVICLSSSSPTDHRDKWTGQTGAERQTQDDRSSACHQHTGEVEDRDPRWGRSIQRCTKWRVGGQGQTPAALQTEWLSELTGPTLCVTFVRFMSSHIRLSVCRLWRWYHYTQRVEHGSLTICCISCLHVLHSWAVNYWLIDWLIKILVCTTWFARVIP